MASLPDLFTLTIQGVSQTLRVRTFTGKEALSRLFSFHIEFFTDNISLAFADIVGKSATLTVSNKEGETQRAWNGIVARLSQSRVGTNTAEYWVEVVPKPWRLTRRADCRIFQEMTAPDIIKKVFDGAGLSSGDDYKLSLQGTYTQRDYCVQYRETDFNFVSRLMEHEGIAYYFDHSDGKHVMVLVDAPSAFPSVPGTSTIKFREGTLLEDHVHTFDYQEGVTSGKWTHRDYDFTKPTYQLESNSQGSTNTDLELYDYPGDFLVSGDGTSLAKVRLEEEETPGKAAAGAGGCSTFSPGGTFTLSEHARDSFNQEYLLTSVYHSGTQGVAFHEAAPAPGGRPEYSNTFTCIPSSAPFRPARVTPRPVVHGLQSALVVGPSGEEIYTDQYGRIKVQFYWDRLGSKDEKSSCWIRVAQSWAGTGWGTLFIPRINQEVIVDFLEGDPDKPLVVGCVYHASNTVPYALPDNKTRSVIKTNSSTGGGGSNELRFEDKKDSEEIYLHGQKDYTILIEHDKNQTINHDETLEVKNDRTKKVDHDETITIGNNLTAEVKNDKSTTIDGNSTEEVKKDLTLTVDGNYVQTVKKEKDVKVTDKIYVECGSAKITIQSSGDIKIEGANLTVTMSGDVKVNASGNFNVQASGNVSIQASGNADVKANGNASVQASGPVKVKGATVGIN